MWVLFVMSYKYGPVQKRHMSFHELNKRTFTCATPDGGRYLPLIGTYLPEVEAFLSDLHTATDIIAIDFVGIFSNTHLHSG